MFQLFALSTLLAQATPSPSPSGACFHDAQVVKPAIPRDFEPGDQELAATISVTVAPDGSVKSATVTKSSGDLEFDMASVRAAKKSLYGPKLVDCKPVESTAPFRATFTPGWAVRDTPSPSPTVAPTPCSSEARGIVLDDDPYEGPSKGPPPYYAVVEVRVNADGSVKWAHIYKSSNMADYDHESLSIARHLLISPKIGSDCKPIEGSFFFINVPRGYAKPQFTPRP